MEQIKSYQFRINSVLIWSRFLDTDMIDIIIWNNYQREQILLHQTREREAKQNTERISIILIIFGSAYLMQWGPWAGMSQGGRERATSSPTPVSQSRLIIASPVSQSRNIFPVSQSRMIFPASQSRLIITSPVSQSRLIISSPVSQSRLIFPASLSRLFIHPITWDNVLRFLVLG